MSSSQGLIRRLGFIRGLLCVVFGCISVSIAVLPLQAAAETGIALNEDDSHFFGSRKAGDMTLEGLNAFVDQYAGTQVTHLFLCPNAQKASFRSRVFDPIWQLDEGQRPPEAGFAKAWCDNARLLNERGLDPYAVWIARSREKGISPWLSMRMNDVHNVDDADSYIHASFWRKHPDYWRVPGSTGGWTDRAFDYGIPEVREYHMAFVRELLERYDPDGLELDWMRFGYHFKPGHEAEGAALLTQFMRDVRALTGEWSAKRGHAIALGARVPAHPDAAIGLGMDAIRWVQEGLIDRLVATPFWATTDFDIPVELWRERLGHDASNVTFCAGAEILLRAYPGGPALENDLASTRGFAAAHLHRGADQIYLFNYMDPDPMRGPAGSYRKLLEEGLSARAVELLPRRYPVTYRDTVPAGVPNNVVLPVSATSGGEFQIHVGPRPVKGAAHLVLGITQSAVPADLVFEVKINGKPCPGAFQSVERDNLPAELHAVEFPVSLELVNDGPNSVQVQQVAGASGAEIAWVELEVTP